MSAGNLSVSVEADLQKLEAQFAAIEKGFVESGKRAMQAFQKATAETPLPADDMVGRLAGEIKAAGKEAGQAFAREVGIAIKERCRRRSRSRSRERCPAQWETRCVKALATPCAAAETMGV